MAVFLALLLAAYLMGLLTYDGPDPQRSEDPFAEWKAVPFPARLTWQLVGLSLAFLPFVVWRIRAHRHAIRSPHSHVRGATLPPPGIIDVCEVATSARRRSGTFEIVLLSAMVVLGALHMATLNVGIFIAAYLLSAPAVWLLSKLMRGRGTQARQGLRMAQRIHVRRVQLPRPFLSSVAAVVLHVAGLIILGFAWIYGVIIVFILLPLFITYPLDVGEYPLYESIFVPIFAVAFVLFLPILTRLGRRLRLAGIGLWSAARGRPFALYLRTFADDLRLLPGGSPRWWHIFDLLSFRSSVPYEEVVAGELGHRLPVVTVTEPEASRFYLPLGAFRRRPTRGDWQTLVSSMMQAASLVVVSVGTSDGVLWEVRRAINEGCLDRLILLVPPDDDTGIRQRWKACTAAVVDAGGPPIQIAVDPATVILSRLERSGRTFTVIGDRRDQPIYAAGLRAGLEYHRGTPVVVAANV
jgi:hypothetical protein